MRGAASDYHYQFSHVELENINCPQAELYFSIGKILTENVSQWSSLDNTKLYIASWTALTVIYRISKPATSNLQYTTVVEKYDKNNLEWLKKAKMATRIQT